jgi:hypothetical protein
MVLGDQTLGINVDRAISLSDDRVAHANCKQSNEFMINLFDVLFCERGKNSSNYLRYSI